MEVSKNSPVRKVSRRGKKGFGSCPLNVSRLITMPTNDIQQQ